MNLIQPGIARFMHDARARRFMMREQEDLCMMREREDLSRTGPCTVLYDRTGTVPAGTTSTIGPTVRSYDLRRSYQGAVISHTYTCLYRYIPVSSPGSHNMES